jgi:hypothetical protein
MLSEALERAEIAVAEPSAPANVPVTRIRPSRGWVRLDLRESPASGVGKRGRGDR